MAIHHDTLEFVREFDAAPAQLFGAYADPALREIWSKPSPTAEVRIDSADVRTGGTERGRCGPKGDMRWTTEVSYLSVTRDQHIVFTEVLKEGAKILTIALVSFEFQEMAGEKTRLLLTDKITSFVGPDAVEDHEQGYIRALENLSSMMQGTAATA